MADVHVQERFLKGVAISCWQNAIDHGSQWTSFVHSLWPFKRFGWRNFKGDHVGLSTNFWDR
jgi:hypothetical protein